MSRRDQIRMTGHEVHDFLAQEKVVVVSTFGPRGWPHSMPLWYTLREPEAAAAFPLEAGGVEIWTWTFGKSQKVRNLERDPRATVLAEAGEDRYDQLRGVMIEAEAVVHRDTETCVEFGLELALRYGSGASEPEQMREAVEAQAPKRVALQYRPLRVVSWDHRKLGGTY